MVLQHNKIQQRLEKNSKIYEGLNDDIRSKVKISNEELEIVNSKFHYESFRKNEIIRPKYVHDFKVYFIVTGCVRSFLINSEGMEQTVDLAFENFWIGDIDSFLIKKPSSLTLVALENTEMISINRADLKVLYETVSCMEKYFRILYSYAYMSFRKRFYQFVSWSATQKYAFILENKPYILQRVPLQYIASYIGIAPESLSRIRKNFNH